MIEPSIHALGDYHAPVEDSLPDLRALTTAETGKPVRRIGRFIQSALIGAVRCVGSETPPAGTAVYMTSRRGDLEVTLEVMEPLFKYGEAPKPLSFINTVSNAACFYVARHFGLHGRSCFISNTHFSFETALQLALLDIETGQVTSALVGSVDIAAPPIGIHRRRLDLAEATPVAEASHWLWLRAGGQGASVVRSVEMFADRAALSAWLARQALDPARTVFNRGQFLPADQVAGIMGEAGLTQVKDAAEGRAYYDSQSVAALGDFIREGEAAVLLQVNANDSGGYSAILLEATRG
ncbi:beta-ketoacyl synthase N-terminal-like domain-containing protein [Brevundimonas sp. FT23028]|uniref:beta-ketoacyl synthase N-terminal-like domain-containing protein n=1 Tax=Brevundimonas sp. FT23028 TaxID=3393748 RepID=UPI003B58868E